MKVLQSREIEFFVFIFFVIFQPGATAERAREERGERERRLVFGAEIRPQFCPHQTVMETYYSIKTSRKAFP